MFSLCITFNNINIHRNINNKYSLSSVLTYSTTESLAQHVNELSATFTISKQEDPSELLTFLLVHLNKCVTPTETAISMNPSLTAIQHVFGLNTQFVSKCNGCLRESTSVNCCNDWSIPINSYSRLTEALAASCSREELDGNNLHACTNCKKKVSASRKFEIIHASTVIFIVLQRFRFDNDSKMTRKIHQVIIYPEVLNLAPYFNKDIQ